MTSHKTKINTIVVECYLDTMILFALGIEPNHIHQGFSGVANTMQNKISKTVKVVGIIDKDKAKNLPSYFKKFDLIEIDNDNKFEVYKLGETRLLIKIDPAAEKWLAHCNSQLEKPVKVPYGGDIPKKETVLMDSKVKDYINTIKQRRSPAFIKLEATILDFLKH